MFVYTDLLLHITVLVYADLNHYDYIIEVERDISRKYKAYPIGKKKAILEETKVYSTREVAKKYCMNEATIIVLRIYIYSATNLDVVMEVGTPCPTPLN